MANLFNKYIYETYKSIVGIGQAGTSGLIPGTIQPLTDGEGNELPIRVSDTDVEVDYLTSKNLFIEAYGEVIDQNGVWVGPQQGFTGSSGTSGTSGKNGTNGSNGSSGTSGKNGTNGSNGSSGTSGTSGKNGTNGSNGSSGSSGTSGTSGQNGTSGTSGMNGAVGSNGTSGTSGISQPGTPGTSGTSGTSGVSNDGTSGTSGTSGIDGIATGRIYYFNNSDDSDVSPYKVLSNEPSIATLQTITVNLAGNQQDALVQEFLTSEFGFTIIPSGIQRFHFHALKPQQNDDIQIYATLQLANSAGVGYSPIYATSSNVITWNDAVTPSETYVDIVFPHTTVAATDRMIVKIYFSSYVATAKSVNWYTQDGEYSYVTTSIAAQSGTSGTSGVNGTSGTSGLDGSQGPQGTNGTSGTDGSSGTSGLTGEAGTSGTSGTSGGGSSLTPAMTLLSLPPTRGGTFGDTASWRTWVPTTGYSRANIGVSASSAQWSVFSIAEGETINNIQFFVATAVAGSTCWAAIYRLEKDSSGRLYPTTRLYDAGSVSSATTGTKTINLVTPFTMAQETYGAVAIIIGGSASGINVSGWSNAVWWGNGGMDYSSDGTVYRNLGLVAGYSGGTAPSSFASNTSWTSATSNPLYVLIK